LGGGGGVGVGWLGGGGGGGWVGGVGVIKCGSGNVLNVLPPAASVSSELVWAADPGEPLLFCPPARSPPPSQRRKM